MTNDKEVRLLSDVGSDTGMRFEYRKNLTSVRRTVDYTKIANRVYPRGELVEGQRFSPSGYDGNPGYVEDAAAQTALGGDGDPVIVSAPVICDDLLDVSNLCQTPNFSGTYTGGLCEDYAEVGSPTTSENTTAQYLKSEFCTKSQKVVGVSDGDGISQAITIETGQYYSMFAWIYVAAGSVKMRMDKGVTYSAWASTSGSGMVQIAIEGMLADGTAGGFEILQNGAGAATFYCCAVQFMKGAVNKGVNGLVTGDNRANLITLAERELAARKDSVVTYELGVKDLYARDSTAYPHEQFACGDTVTVRDHELSIDAEVRVIKKVIDLINPANVQIVVGNKAVDLSHFLKLISQRTGIKFGQYSQY